MILLIEGLDHNLIELMSKLEYDFPKSEINYVYAYKIFQKFVYFKFHVLSIDGFCIIDVYKSTKHNNNVKNPKIKQ